MVDISPPKHSSMDGFRYAYYSDNVIHSNIQYIQTEKSVDIHVLYRKHITLSPKQNRNIGFYNGPNIE